MMESVAEFRVNSGLAPAESGLGAGGNITVISKSGGNRFAGSLLKYVRNDALDSESKYPVATEFDPKKQELELNQFGGWSAEPIRSNRTFFFLSYEGLKQETGLSFTEAVPSDEAIRRIMAGEFVGTQSGLSAARTQAVAPLPPASRAEPSPPRIRFWRWRTSRRRRRSASTASRRASTTASTTVRRCMAASLSDGDVDTPDRHGHTAPCQGDAAAAEFCGQSSVNLRVERDQ